MSFFFKKEHVHTWEIATVHGREVDTDFAEYTIQLRCWECMGKQTRVTGGSFEHKPVKEALVEAPEPKTPTNHRRTHCRKGHRLTLDNTVVAKNGDRRCRTCRNAWMRSYKRNQKAQQPIVVDEAPYFEAPLLAFPHIKASPAGNRRRKHTHK